MHTLQVQFMQKPADNAKVRFTWSPTQTGVSTILWYFPLRPIEHKKKDDFFSEGQAAQKNTGTEAITIWFHNKNITVPKCSLSSRKVTYIITAVLTLEFQLAVFSPVSVIFLTDHPSQIHSTEAYPKS